jgi:hypothetical protein
VSVAFGKLYIADTNNHAIRVADLKTKRVETLQIKGLEKLRPRMREKQFMGEVIEAAQQTIEPGDATLTLQLELPTGYKLNALAPSAVAVAPAQKQVVSLKDAAGENIRNPKFPVSIPIKAVEGDTTVEARYVIYYCEAAKESLCFIKEAKISIPVKVKKGAGARNVSATYKLAL